MTSANTPEEALLPKMTSEQWGGGCALHSRGTPLFSGHVWQQYNFETPILLSNGEG